MVNANRIKKIPGVAGIDISRASWTMVVRVKGRKPEEVLREIREIGLEISEYRILRGKK